MKQIQNKFKKLIVFSVFLLLLINFPILTCINKNIEVMHMPLLYLYIFVVWVICIVGFYVMINRNESV